MKDAGPPGGGPRRLVSTGGAIAVLVLLVALVVGTGVWQVLESRGRLREQILAGNLTTARTAAEVVATDVERRLQLVQAIGQRPLLIEAAGRGRWADAAAHLEDVLEVDLDLASAAVFDATGRLQARFPPDPTVMGRKFSFRDYFKGAVASDRPYLSEVFLQQGTPRQVVVAVAYAIRGPANAIVGVLQATVPIARLKLLAVGVRVPQGGSLQIYDRNGHAVTGAAADPERAFESVPVVAHALSGVPGVGELPVPGLRGKRLTAYAPVRDVGWGVVVEQPQSAANVLLGPLTARLGVIAGLVVLFATAGAVATTRLLRRLAREHNQSTAILGSIADGAVITDPAGIILSINPALRRLAGWTEEEVRGRPYLETYQLSNERGDPLPAEQRFLTRAMESGEVVVSRGYELMLATRDGRRIPVAVAGTPVVDHRGELLAGVGIIRDVSYEHEVDQLKSSFVSMVSHELRTPLTMLQGFSELLLSRELSPEKSREALERIHGAALRLSRLIDDLLSVARLEAGKVALRTGPVDLAEVIDEVVSPFASQDARHIGVDVDAGLPPALADRDKLVQILTNLVSNAVKYSPPEAPVRVAARRNGTALEVAVEDRGIGLSEDDVTRLFEKFSRIDRPEVRKVSGTGLGLFITKSLVEMQGGRIWVRSEPGRGSTFTFSLPVAGQDDREEAT